MSIFRFALRRYGGTSQLAWEPQTRWLPSAARIALSLTNLHFCCYRQGESRVLAVGADAKRMIGRTRQSLPNALKDGVIADLTSSDASGTSLKARERK